MGDPKFARKSYDTPSHPWQGERIKAEAETVSMYGLKNKRELWKAQTILRNLRKQSKNLQARVRVNDEQARLEANLLLKKCARMGLLPMEGATLDDVLGLNAQMLLDRRFQTIVYRKGLATTAKQARQFIIHGHVAIEGRKVNIPGYLVKRGEEDKITFNPHSPISNELHPLRAMPKGPEHHETAPQPVAEVKVENKELKKVAGDIIDTAVADLPDIEPEQPKEE